VLGTISEFAFRHREIKKNLCRGDRGPWPVAEHNEKFRSVRIPSGVGSCDYCTSADWNWSPYINHRKHDDDGDDDDDDDNNNNNNNFTASGLSPGGSGYYPYR
jgi:hypothetical protein